MTCAGGQAFTTGGKLISSCPARTSWRRSSYRPYQGTYVRADIAAALDLLQGDTPGESPQGVVGYFCTLFCVGMHFRVVGCVGAAWRRRARV